MRNIDEKTALGNRIMHLAQTHNISDFYVTVEVGEVDMPVLMGLGVADALELRQPTQL